MKIRTAKLTAIRKIEIFEEEIEPLNEGDVIVQMKSVGICGSDMHYFKEGGLGTFKSPLPMYMGHEPAGIIVESKSKIFPVGTRVAVEPGMPCVTSYWSMKGKQNLCEKGTFMGANSRGAFSDYVVVNEIQLAKIPDEMSYDLGALMEPIGVALHTYNLLSPKFTDSAIILGAGPIGLCLLSILKKSGISTIYMIDKLNYRVDIAKKLGATDAFLLNDDFVKKINEKTGGFGCNLAFDTGGTSDSINACLKIASTAGKVALIGIPESDYTNLNPHGMRTKELQIYNIRRSNQTLHDCVKNYSGNLNDNIEKIITHKFNFNEIQKAFELVAEYSDNVLKCMIKFD
jgi:L-iditol 2-dehydrogenase